jgi:hypothetical protein
VRFDEYFKIQWYDGVSLCWRDIQKSYETTELARAAMTGDKTWRIMVVTPRGRYPLQEA